MQYPPLLNEVSFGFRITLKGSDETERLRKALDTPKSCDAFKEFLLREFKKGELKKVANSIGRVPMTILSIQSIVDRDVMEGFVAFGATLE